MTDAKYQGVPSGEMVDKKSPRKNLQSGLQAIIRDSPWKKYFMAVWAMLECVFFGGLVFGWGSLVFVLKKEGIYADLCQPWGGNSSNYSLFAENNTSRQDTSCPEQDEKFNLAFTFGTTLMTFSSPIMGHIQYVFGTRIARIALMTFFLCGSLVTAFLDTSTPWLIFIGLSCMAVGGLPVLVTNIQVANMFLVGGSSIVGLLSGSFDASAAVQLMVKIAYENGISRKVSYLFISSLHIMVVISTFILLPKTIIPKADPALVQQKEVETEEVEKMNGHDGRLASDSDERPLRDVKPRLLDCALSPIFLSLVGWLSILQLRFYFFVGTLNPWLIYITNHNDHLVSHYTNASLFIQMAGPLTSLLSGFIFDLERKRNSSKPTVTQRRLQPSVVPQTAAACFGILLSVLVLVPAPEVLYMDFIVLTFFRSFMYGTGAAYIQMIFPAEYFGFLYGLMIVISGVIGALQFPLFMWLESPPRGPQKVNIFLLILTLVPLLHPLHIWLTCRAAGKRRDAAQGDQVPESEYVFITKRSKCM